ncbi:pre-peptidase C-terminal domain-containing protein [Plectonema cf. radiosum LEGE 06105]|uniref:Pre-peptidase C-terminal domain-containing protein n=1 Tax=Plectonema cf. radiosum LEGE 06105 TaxID=945769 RepID=A0A8J7FG45_9CYAN|nr:SBBP repeat-containing protein [Plectonema radiosum]MBE9215768.1 pre-peptidase C-terminal domain-containing protein [Plectonema cf. radiosum LEGE 06105]
MNGSINKVEWVQQFGGIFADSGFGIAADESGNSYITGQFQLDANFGSTTLSTILNDAFVAKLDNRGNLLWAENFNSTSFESISLGFGIDSDKVGNTYTTGFFSGTVEFGNNSLTSVGDSDVFVTKLDSNGNVIWVEQLEDTGVGVDLGIGVSSDDLGNAYVIGIKDIDTETEIFDITDPTSVNGEGFISKLDSSGSLVWTQNFDSTSLSSGTDIATDKVGNSYVIGTFLSDVTLGNQTFLSSGDTDVFVTKLDTTGNVKWSQNLGGTLSNTATSISLDSESNIYVTGEFEGTATFGDISLTSNGESDAFVAKIDNSGNILWAQSFGGTLLDSGASITVDEQDKIYVTGSFEDTVSFGDTILTSSSENDGFILKLDTDGNILQAEQLGYSLLDIAASNAGNIYGTGAFENTATFGDTTFTSQGFTDGFVVNLAFNETPVANDEPNDTIGEAIDEPNDTIGEAINSGINGIGSYFDIGFIGDNGNVAPSDDVDLIELFVNAGERVTIDIDAEVFGSSLDPLLRLFDSAGNEVAFNDDFSTPDESFFSSDPFIDFTASKSDTYYVGVSSFNNDFYNPFVEGSGTGTGFSTGEYDIFIDVNPIDNIFEPNDTIGEAINSGINGIGSYFDIGFIGDNGNVAPSDDVDLIELFVNAGERVTIDIDAEVFGSSLDPVLRLFDSAGNEVAFNDDFSTPDESFFSSDPFIDFTASKSDTYYVGVSSFNNDFYNPFVEGSGTGTGFSTGEYDIFIDVNPNPIFTTDINGTTVEAIDLTGFATDKVTVDYTISREADFNNQVYFYKVDDITGSVGGVAVGESGYLQAALNNLISPVFSTSDDNTESGSVQIDAGSIVVPLIIADGDLTQALNGTAEVYFSYLGANTNNDNFDHIKLLDSNTFGFEDLPNGGDKDFNDIVIKIDSIA